MSDHLANLYLGLAHYPIRDKNGEVVTTSIYAPDIHDISRLARTYGLGGYYVIHPSEAQRRFAGQILGHWRKGFGHTYNNLRTEALSVARLAPSIDDAIGEIAEARDARPLVVTTTAQAPDDAWDFAQVRQKIADDRPLLLLFGTGWGMTLGLLRGYDGVLQAVLGRDGYNHLSVRSAASIIVDRIAASGAD